MLQHTKSQTVPQDGSGAAEAPTTILEWRLAYIALGWPSFPAPADGSKKSLKSRDTPGCFMRWGATKNVDVIRQDCAKWPASNVGIPTGFDTGIFVLDLDTAAGHGAGVDGAAALAAWEATNNCSLPPTLTAESPSGSQHLIFKCPSLPQDEYIKTQQGVLPGVDVLGEGGMFLAAPSNRPGKGQYQWLNDLPIAAPPLPLLALVIAQQVAYETADHGSVSAALVAAAIRAIPNDASCGWDHWIKVGLALYAATNGSDEGLELFHEWSALNDDKYDAANTDNKWQECHTSPPTRSSFGTLHFLADKYSPGWRRAYEDGLTEAQRAEIARLSQLPPIQYDQQRVAAAERLGIRVGTLDDLVARVRPPAEDVAGQGTPLNLDPINPWTESVEGTALIAELEAAIKKHVILSDEQALATGLWTMHAHGLDYAEHSPRLHIASPAKRCGKSTLLATVAKLVPKPIPTENITVAALFRIVEKAQPTLLIDEADIFLRDNEDMRAMLNAGHGRNGQVIRTVGDDFEPRAFSVWGPVVIAGIGHIPDTLADRSITISLRRRKRNEEITRLRSNRTQHLTLLARRTARWVADNHITLAEADPVLPEELSDREQDNWRPLIAIADAISAKLGARTRAAAVKISEDETMEDESAAIMCLADVAAIFAQRRTETLSSEAIVTALCAMDERPWREWRRGNPMTKNSLARLLKPFGIQPKKLRLTGQTATFRGYEVKPVNEAKDRYCEAVAEPDAPDPNEGTF